MKHYCTYFDRGFLPQGLALWKSLRAHDPSALLWVLALDEETNDVLSRMGDEALHVVRLAKLEADDPALVAAKANRSRVEYYFTLSPCWPRWLLNAHPDIDRVTYLDADLFFYGSPTPIFAAMDAARASVLVTAHRFPAALRHYERHGKYNVGVLSFRSDETGLACLDDWRERCLEWCYDRLEHERYADQKYLNAWPDRLGAGLLVLGHPGVNLAPWNWTGYSIDVPESGITIDDQPLIVFHFAALRSLGKGWWDSGQLDYGVMPKRVRNAIYRPYFTALDEVRVQLGESIAPLRRAKMSTGRWLSSLFFGVVWHCTPGGVRALGGGPWSPNSGAWLARWRRERSGK